MFSKRRMTGPRVAFLLLAALHLFFLAYLYSVQGIHADKEALKFTGSAEALLRGDPHDLLHRYPTYGTYILFLVPFAAIGNYWLAVSAQVILGFIAAWRLKQLVLRTTGSDVWAWVATAGLLLSYLVQTWTLSLYSEPLMTSL
ncbi:MAG: hypothetical protein KDB88_04540, partial [Flavobacteriales bacterium]|nr:hypothetical protein [Flavobacteriales bacterium]